MKNITPEQRADRIALASEFYQNYTLDVMPAADLLEAGEQRNEVLQLTAAARPDLQTEVKDWLNDEMNQDGAQGVLVRNLPGELVATIWARRFSYATDIPLDRRVELQTRMEKFGLMECELFYAANVSVNPAHQGKHIASMALGAALINPDLSPGGERAVLYRRSNNNEAGRRLERKLGAYTLLHLGPYRRQPGVQRYLHAMVTSPEI